MNRKRSKAGIILVSLFFLLFCPTNLSYASTLNVSAKSAILIEQESGRILFEKDAYTKRRIASITKIMTAILAIESGKLDDKVKISSKSVNIEGSSIYLKEGEIITLEDLVYGLMLKSGNDAAIAIANHVGGSVEGFVYMMNEKAKAIGMKDTVFSNPHGLDDSENHYSTAYDMALLMKYAMKDKTFRKISSTEKYKTKKIDGESWGRLWKNKNKLVTGLYKYSTGGKTGYTKRANRTLVSTASKNDMDLIAVTLDDPDDWNDHIALFEHAFDTYQKMKLIDKGKYKHATHDFYRNKLIVKQPVYYPLTEEESQLLTSSITLLRPPKGKKWEKEGVPAPVGYLKIKLEGEEIAKVPLFFDGQPAAEKKNFLESFKNIFFLVAGVDQSD
ncbi:D-alanyl-D-alanine carboxypeptidase [Pueribacillus theae]|uniref:serine-type D-Ala-D-Ala carboxypeptidase n=1 Tax=Pueribacillus theae TaxID=2171751 RepID=A0A2U1K4G7_9BACI|nr:D-alanyl-D-alanine carboxypeptidase family protein [Pueribacillus theae]PWA12411.1 D-alanyl-D-alanine carboxypeptidase [Pueribacillus theae]